MACARSLHAHDVGTVGRSPMAGKALHTENARAH
jgi:hypothetical protein